MGTLNKDTFAGVTYAVMGMGTEGGSTPYQITVTADGGWGGTPRAFSGYTVGAMQFDFGQRSGTVKKPNFDPLTGKPYNESFVDAVNDWAKSTGQAELSAKVAKQLTYKGNTSEFTWLDTTDRDTIRAFGQTPEGQDWINNHLEKGLIREYEPKVNGVLGTPAFKDWSESDLIVAAAVLAKAQNQSPKSLVELKKTVNKSAEKTTDYTLNDFLEDTKTVESTNGNYHFTKAAKKAQDYVELRNSDQVGDILKAAEAKIAAQDFSPTRIGPDSDLWLTRKVNSDDDFRGNLKAAVAQARKNDTDPSIETFVNDKKQKALLVVVPEDNYIEIQAPKGEQSAIIQDGHSFFYNGGDAEGRRFAIKSLEVALAADATKGAGTTTTAQTTDGHWEDQTYYDPMSGLPVGGVNKVWVADAPTASTAAPTATPGAAATAISPTPTTAPHPNHYSSGAIYLSRDGASATLANGQVITAGAGETLSLNSAGQLVLSSAASGFDAQDGITQRTTYGANGKVQSTQLTQTVSGQDQDLVQGAQRSFTYTNAEGHTSTTTATFQVGIGWVDTGTGELVLGLEQWKANPALGSADQPVLLESTQPQQPAPTATTTIDGVTYTRAQDSNGQTQWLDANGKSPEQRLQQNLDASDHHFLAPALATPTSLGADSTQATASTAVLQLATYNGQQYQVHPQGGLSRDLGNGQTEWRDPVTGEGIITQINSQDQTEPVQKLSATDQVQTGWDDGQWRITKVEGSAHSDTATPFSTASAADPTNTPANTPSKPHSRPLVLTLMLHKQ